MNEMALSRNLNENTCEHCSHLQNQSQVLRFCTYYIGYQYFSTQESKLTFILITKLKKKVITINLVFNRVII